MSQFGGLTGYQRLPTVTAGVRLVTGIGAVTKRGGAEGGEDHLPWAFSENVASREEKALETVRNR